MVEKSLLQVLTAIEICYDQPIFTFLIPVDSKLWNKPFIIALKILLMLTKIYGYCYG